MFLLFLSSTMCQEVALQCRGLEVACWWTPGKRWMSSALNMGSSIGLRCGRVTGSPVKKVCLDKLCLDFWMRQWSRNNWCQFQYFIGALPCRENDSAVNLCSKKRYFRFAWTAKNMFQNDEKVRQMNCFNTEVCYSSLVSVQRGTMHVCDSVTFCTLDKESRNGMQLQIALYFKEDRLKFSV